MMKLLIKKNDQSQLHWNLFIWLFKCTLIWFDCLVTSVRPHFLWEENVLDSNLAKNKNGHHLLTHVILNLYDFISYVSFTINICMMDFKRHEGE